MAIPGFQNAGHVAYELAGWTWVLTLPSSRKFVRGVCFQHPPDHACQDCSLTRSQDCAGDTAAANLPCLCCSLVVTGQQVDLSGCQVPPFELQSQQQAQSRLSGLTTTQQRTDDSAGHRRLGGRSSGRPAVRMQSCCSSSTWRAKLPGLAASTCAFSMLRMCHGYVSVCGCGRASACMGACARLV